MKKVGFLLGGLLLSLFALPAFAGDFSVAAEFSDYGYKEPHMKGPIRNYGKMKGVSLRYTAWDLLGDYFSNTGNTFARLEGIYMNGKVDYDGYLQDSHGNIVGTAKSEDINDWYVDARVLAGQRYDFSLHFYMDPYVGIAYRYLRDEGQKKSEYAYLRQSNYLYLPVGTDFGFKTGGFSLVVNGEFDILLKGRQESGTTKEMSEQGFSDTTHHQSQGWGARFSLKVEQEVGQIAIFAEPFYRYWKIQDSDVGFSISEQLMQYQASIEPFNITREYGVKVGIKF